MAPLVTQYFEMYFCHRQVLYLNKNFPGFVPSSLIDNKTTFVEVIVWRQTVDKPLPELKLNVHLCVHASLGISVLNYVLL